MREVKTVTIAGAGTMGASMAETFAKFGYEVICYDIFEEAIKYRDDMYTKVSKCLFEEE